MSNNNNNQINVPQAREAMDRFKMQAACSYTNGGKKVQIRVEADYIYSVHTTDENIASNCPNCGGAIGYGVVNCPYCGSHVSNVMSNTWEFKNIRET